MFPFGLVDWATKARAKITDRGALLVTPIGETAPPTGQSNVSQYFKSKLALVDGSSTNQAVNGSSSTQEFVIGSNQNFDIHIKLIQILIADGTPGITNNKFGSIDALSNGWCLDVEESGSETSIVSNAKTNGELLVQSGSNTLFGTGVDVNELSNWTAQEDAKLIYIPMGSWVEGGLRLGRGTNDKLIARVNDDLTNITLFEVTVFGSKNLPGTE